MPEVINPLTPHRFVSSWKDPMVCTHCQLVQHDSRHIEIIQTTVVPPSALSPQPRTFNRRQVEQGARLVLEGLGVDLNDHNFSTTPKRVADVYEEMFCPPETGWPVFDEEYTDIVIMRHHTFYTLCPHHMLPVELCASVAYFPNGKVIGASKLARLIHEVNRKPLTQEKLTDLICQAIKDYTQGTSAGEAVLLKGEHDCFKIRGIKSDADMITMKFKGKFETEPEWQRRFLDLTGGGRVY